MKDQTSVKQNPDQTEHAPRITPHGSEIQQSTTPSIHSPTSLQLFTQPLILREIGSARLAKFLAGFNGELPAALARILATLSDQPAKDPVSSPEVAADDALHMLPALAPPQQSGGGPGSTPLVALADLLASKPLLPQRLRLALFALEAAAAPVNQARLDDAIARRISSVSLSPCCALDRALELWFLVPEELSQFQTDPRNDATMQPCNHSPSRPNPTIQESTNPSIQPGANPPTPESTNPIIRPATAPTIHCSSTPLLQPPDRRSRSGSLLPPRPAINHRL